MPAKTSKPKKHLFHMCHDRIISGMAKVGAADLAVKENPANAFRPSGIKKFGSSSPFSPRKISLLTGKKWKPGRVLGVYFMDGSKLQRQKVETFARQWSAHCSIGFDFTASKANAQIRVSFIADEGSWSYIGTDNLSIKKSEPTMNFGWLRDDSADAEWERVVVHEFGHALGAIHEHQNPKGGIKWNEVNVYKYFSGEPNNWSKEEIEINVLDKYSVAQTNGSKFDKYSIMLYGFDGALIKGGKPTRENRQLSKMDKTFIKKAYPSV